IFYTFVNNNFKITRILTVFVFLPTFPGRYSAILCFCPAIFIICSALSRIRSGLAPFCSGFPLPLPSLFLFSKVWKFASLPIIIVVLDLFTYWGRTNETYFFLFKTIQNSDRRCLCINFYLTYCLAASSFLFRKNV